MALKKTWVMNGVNLNHVSATRHLDRMMDCGFLRCIGEGDLYELTQEGKAFLEEYRRFRLIEMRILRLNGLVDEQQYVDESLE
ncbi:winged helix-turn-helix domain-containing protein [Candidatus Bathyarchaeota archaeon]|nr:winged helix-turn-helix domain-containing protein [Candidatus Bathyarchaeota archaeon]